MKAYYICDVLTDADGNLAACEVVRRAAFATDPTAQNDTVSAMISTYPSGHPQAGQLQKPWCLCVVDAINHVKYRTDSRIDFMPVFSFDTRMGALNTLMRTKLDAAITKRGISFGGYTDNHGYREVVKKIGQILEPTFNEANWE